MSSLKFGTSGLRGLVSELGDDVCFSYASAFLRWMSAAHGMAAGGSVLIGYDLRGSSVRIADACMAAVRGLGLVPINCGALPTPALALSGQMLKAPAIMVTGSHIPADRNGLKFYRADGEIDKRDEAGILELVNLNARAVGLGQGEAISSHALEAYGARCRSVLARGALRGLRIGVYQHSSVARDFMSALLGDLGATVIEIARSDVFVPVDTEALRAEDVAIAHEAVREHRLDGLISTDGDADRPLLADEAGRFFRGDLLGVLTAKFLGATCVVTPVTSTSLVEGSRYFARTIRTKVGSPFVIEGMEAAKADGVACVVGFEANGGVLLGSDVDLGGRALAALPTRDAMLPILCVLGMSVREGKALSRLTADLPQRFNGSGRLEHIEQSVTRGLLESLQDVRRRNAYFEGLGRVVAQDAIDGARFILESGDVIHYRASGNAPELRCYSEAGSAQDAERILQWGLAAAARSVGRG